MRSVPGGVTFEVMAEAECALYDLVAIGSGLAGQHAALQAAALGKRAAVVERSAIGGLFANTGAIPARTIRSEVVGIGRRRTDAYRSPETVRESTIGDLLWRTQEVIEAERDAASDRLRHAGVRVIPGAASFLDPHRLEVRGPGTPLVLRAERIVIAVGTVPARPRAVAFDEATILDPEGIVQLGRIPRTLTVIGAGPVGLESASIAAALGVRVTLVDRKPRLLEYVDSDLVEALRYHLQGVGVVFKLGEEVQAIERVADGRAVTHLENGEQLGSEVVLFTAGRRGATDDLRLAAAGLAADARGRIRVDPELRTYQPHIFAVGDVLGHPNLAATAIQQGRDAALIAFGHRPSARKTAPPHAIYTIPELSFVGAGEPELSQAGVPYVAGVAEYRDLPSAQIAGVRSGRLKLIVHATTRTVLGVHIFGDTAAELVHLGQTVIASDLTVDYLIDAAFNLPTFSSAYAVAALDAAARMPSACRNGFRRNGAAKSPMRAQALPATVTP